MTTTTKKNRRLKRLYIAILPYFHAIKSPGKWGIGPKHGGKNMVNITFPFNLSNLTPINDTIKLPKPHYETLPGYTPMLIINIICVSLIIKGFPAWLTREIQPKSHFGKLLCSDRFLLEIMSWGNLFLLAWNIIMPFLWPLL